jgi:hypothetical protein
MNLPCRAVQVSSGGLRPPRGVEVPIAVLLHCICSVSVSVFRGHEGHWGICIYGHDLRFSTQAFARAGTETPHPAGDRQGGGFPRVSQK